MARKKLLEMIGHEDDPIIGTRLKTDAILFWMMVYGGIRNDYISVTLYVKVKKSQKVTKKCCVERMSSMSML